LNALLIPASRLLWLAFALLAAAIVASVWPALTGA